MDLMEFMTSCKGSWHMAAQLAATLQLTTGSREVVDWKEKAGVRQRSKACENCEKFIGT